MVCRNGSYHYYSAGLLNRVSIQHGTMDQRAGGEQVQLMLIYLVVPSVTSRHIDVAAFSCSYVHDFILLMFRKRTQALYRLG